jgi:hypothetical protein
MLPTKLQFIWLSSFKGENFLEIDHIRNKNCMWWTPEVSDVNHLAKINGKYKQIQSENFYNVAITHVFADSS